MNFPVITLCGSLRAGKPLWDLVAHELSLKGFIVITIHVWEWEKLHHGDMLQEKELLDKIHRQRIDMADAIYVIDIVNGEEYVGDSTKGEIDYAVKAGKIVRYHSWSIKSDNLRKEVKK